MVRRLVDSSQASEARQIELPPDRGRVASEKKKHVPRIQQYLLPIRKPGEPDGRHLQETTRLGVRLRTINSWRLEVGPAHSFTGWTLMGNVTNYPVGNLRGECNQCLSGLLMTNIKR